MKNDMAEKNMQELLNQLEKEQMVATNAYFVLAEASDMMLRHVEFLLDLRKRKLHQRVKQRHNRLMDKIQKLKTEYDNYQECYDVSFGGDYSKQDDLRKSAAYMARLLLLISDRCYTEKEGGDKERMIEEYIYHMPEKGFVTNRMLENFVIR